MTALRILVVEDNALIAMLLAETLAGMGHEVCAIEATEMGAVVAAARYSPDLMIVDARLREGDGISAVDHILREGFIPHIFVSGDVLKPAALDHRAVLLQKPYDEADLVKAIRLALTPWAVV